MGEPITVTDFRSGLLDLAASFNRPLDPVAIESYRTGLGVSAVEDDVRLTCAEWRAVVFRIKRDTERAQFFPSVGELLACLFTFRAERHASERLLPAGPELTIAERKANQRRWAEMVRGVVAGMEMQQ